MHVMGAGSPSSSYSHRWLRFWRASAVIGMLLGWLVYGAEVGAAIFLVGFAAGMVLHVATGSRELPGTTRSWLQAGWLTGAVCLGLPAVARGVSGALALLLVVLAVVSCPPVVAAMVRLSTPGGSSPYARVARRTGATRATAPRATGCGVSPVSRPVGPAITAEQVAAMETAELCRAWRRSYLGLAAASRPEELAQ